MSFLNTVPLIWGMLHGRQRDLFDLSVAVPAECARRLAGHQADIGIVPAVELLRQDLEVIHGAGITSLGPVRSILLVTKVPPARIRTLAADSSSRTSVMLSRIILERRYGVHPVYHSRPARLRAMLEEHDAALLIGDPALHVEPSLLEYECLDLGQVWTEMTGLPMVFAVWAGHRAAITAQTEEQFLDSYHFGKAQLEEIVAQHAIPRGFSAELGREYLTRYIRFEFGDDEARGLARFLEYAAALEHQPA